MPDKELNPKQTTNTIANNSAAYADFFTTIIVAAMLCGTVISTTHMWIMERHEEFTYMRGATP